MKIQPIARNIVFAQNNQNSKDIQTDNVQNNPSEKHLIALSLGGLATLGAVAAALKTRKTSLEEALRKNGIQLKNNIATLIENGEKYTGKIERYESRNRKETIKFVDGKMEECLYHNILGKELDGYFYKDGVKKLHVSSSKGSIIGYAEYHQNGGLKRGEIICESSAFNWAREHIKKL